MLLLSSRPIAWAETIELEGEFPTQTAIKLNIGKATTTQQSRSINTSRFDCSLTGFTTEQETAFRYALDLWSQVLPTDANISISASFTGSTTNAYSVPITYVKRGDMAYPMSLYNHKFPTDTFAEPAIVIKFCSDLSKWDFNTDYTAEIEEGKYDFVTHALRAIAKGLGFTSSLTGSTTTTIAHKSSVFDTFVRNDADARLCNLENKSVALYSFVSTNAFFAIENYQNYKLYTPSTYNKNQSCSYFDTDVIVDTEKALVSRDKR